MKKVLVIVGPTCTGKSDLSIKIALKYDGEIINADSRQIYRFMDIGTAKPSQEQRQLVAHHLFDILNPDETFSLAKYKKLCMHQITDLIRRNKLPIIVGGTGQYIKAIVEGWNIPKVKPDKRFREYMQMRADNEGSHVLYNELKKIDPVCADRILPTNVRRIIRALEIYNYTKCKPSELIGKEHTKELNSLLIGLTTDRNKLYELIDLRVDNMIRKGLIEEVKKLLELGYDANLPSFSSVGYREIIDYLNGDISYTEAVRRIKINTHRIARKQYTWFKLNDKEIHWYDILSTDYENNIYNVIDNFLKHN